MHRSTDPPTNWLDSHVAYRTMSHLALQESEDPSDQQGLGQSTSQSSQSSLQYAQDSPTIGRAQIQPHPFAGQAINGSSSHSPLPTPSR